MAEKEYIEREAVKKIIGDLHFRNYGVALTTIMEMPAADVVEVKHGEWKEGHYEGGLLDGVNFDKCNICGYERLIEDVKYKTTYKYCPDCGAKMDRKGG